MSAAMETALPQGLPPSGLRLTDSQARARRGRNLAIGLSVAGLALLFYAVTIIKLGPAAWH
ncbi:MAG: hypothetical protein KGI57_01635 [Hyphomicrobiales bacterium]|nr:hypothetical protein [Hyphomicrobiales bacterium]